MAMTQEHKDALAQGRREARAIKSYLEALGSRRPGRPVTPDSLRQRIERLDTKIATEKDPLRRVDLVQQRLDAADAQKRVSASADLDALEAGFIEYAESYSERKGITYAAWREAGVPASVLRKAGIGRGS
ncbi:MAG TPA: hypothetical protein VLG28_09320 [Acidimicrobiia bacterium]|jgi:hypothetical protein|nr:hypothetical protein [Acidimicrobiia bacterium]